MTSGFGDVRGQMRLLMSFSALMALPTVALAGGLNETTDRYVRSQHMCRVATQEGVKPEFSGMDNIRVDSVNFAYADLYGNGSLELISGASDEPFPSSDWMYSNGNRERSRASHQYMFFSPDADFVRPDGTRFLMARTIVVQDFNGDGVRCP